MLPPLLGCRASRSALGAPAGLPTNMLVTLGALGRLRAGGRRGGTHLRHLQQCGPQRRLLHSAEPGLVGGAEQEATLAVVVSLAGAVGGEGVCVCVWCVWCVCVSVQVFVLGGVGRSGMCPRCSGGRGGMASALASTCRLQGNSRLGWTTARRLSPVGRASPGTWRMGSRGGRQLPRSTDRCSLRRGRRWRRRLHRRW